MGTVDRQARVITGLARANRDREAAAWLQTMSEAGVYFSRIWML